MAARHLLHWNGEDLPDELRALPPGTYVIESVDALDDEERVELQREIAALASLQAGKGRTLEQVQQTIDAIVRTR